MTTKVKQLANNQFIINNGGESIFQSYDSIIARKIFDIVDLDSVYWNYSKTTSKYRRIFLDGETTKETQAKIDSGEYLLTDLNQ